MPKQVDHDERRRQLAEALWRLASTSGLEGVSLGQVAAEAGVSKGLVQHYFSSKDEMLVYATGYLRERIEQRISEQVGAASATPLAALRATLAALLPTDEGRRTEAFVANAFLIRAHRDPAIAARVSEGTVLLRRAIADQLGAAVDSGELAAGLDTAVEANILLAIVSGLGEALLLGHHTPDSALALLAHQLNRLAV